MTKLRVYYDKLGKIVATEHRIDENYTEGNSTEKETKWIVVNSEELTGQRIEELEIKRGKLVKKK
jgi:hypothetical protein